MEPSSRTVISSVASREYLFTPDATEIVVSYKKNSEKLLARSNAEKSARPALTRLIKQTEKDPVPFFALHYTEGGVSNHLLVSKETSNFELHGALRKNLSTRLGLAEVTSLWLDLSGLDPKDAHRALEAIVNLAALSVWRPESYGRRKQSEAPARNLSIKVSSKLSATEVKAAGERGISLGHATNLVRTLADMPPNHLNPREYRQRIQKWAKEKKVGFDFWGREALRKKGAGAFLAVVQADPVTESGILHLCAPSRLKKPKQKIALVGKGLCYDTGGYNIKTGDFMKGMHRDMTGSALSLALVEALSALHPEAEFHAYLALAENLISSTAYKPDDVVTAANGLSIEVVDTDAEGRMVLSDTLVLASAAKPDLIIDFATLTGAAIRALDTRRSAVFSNRPKLLDLAVRAGEASGERVWPFPLGDDYREGLKSSVADILQCALGRNADHIYAATFLSEFVEKDVAWVHVDLAAALNKGGLGLAATDTTGFGVRWAAEFVAQFLRI